MKTSRWLGAVIALNLVASVTLAVLWWSLRQQQRAIRDELASQHERAERETARRSAELRQVRREIEGAAGAARVRFAATTAIAPSAGSGVDSFEKQRNTLTDRLRTMPEYTNYLVRNARRRLIEQSGPAIDALRLDPEKRARLVQLLTDRDLATSDAYVLMSGQGQDPNGAAALKVRRQIAEESNAKIRDLLGESGYRSFEEQMAFQQQRRYLLDAFNVAVAERKLPALGEPELLACHRAQSAAQAQVRRPQSREEWAAAIGPRVMGVLSPAQMDLFIDHTYAAMRRTVLRLEATQRLKGG